MGPLFWGVPATLLPSTAVLLLQATTGVCRLIVRGEQLKHAETVQSTENRSQQWACSLPLASQSAATRQQPHKVRQPARKARHGAPYRARLKGPRRGP